MLLDISHARIVHLEWEIKLEDILSGRRKPIKVSTHHECILGSWLYTEGMKKYKHIPEVMRLEEIHATFHSMAQQVINDHAHRKDGSADELFKEVKQLSREIIYLLTKIELEILHRKKRVDVVRHPLRSFAKLFK
jgi:hypothetical protein